MSTTAFAGHSSIMQDPAELLKNFTPDPNKPLDPLLLENGNPWQQHVTTSRISILGSNPTSSPDNAARHV